MSGQKPRVVYGESRRPEWIDMSEHGICEPDWNDRESVEETARMLEEFLYGLRPDKYAPPKAKGGEW